MFSTPPRLPCNSLHHRLPLSPVRAWDPPPWLPLPPRGKDEEGTRRGKPSSSEKKLPISSMPHRRAMSTRALLFCAFYLWTASCARLDGLRRQAERLQPWLVTTRRDLHAHPEIGFALSRTSQAVADALRGMGAQDVRLVARNSGVVAEVGEGSPMVLLRADMDALPLQESADNPVKSTVDGRMHACGHDAHTTMLLGAARVLLERYNASKNVEEDEEVEELCSIDPGERGCGHGGTWPGGTVRFMFQPAEEGGGGAKVAIQDGVMEGVGGTYAIHVWPWLRSGAMATRTGPIMAGAAFFEISVVGRGGHAAAPHATIDPVPAAASIISAIQTVVAREVDAQKPAIISVTRMETPRNAAVNAVPDEVLLQGTLRTLDTQLFQDLRRRLEQLVQSQASVFGCTAKVGWMEGRAEPAPPTINDGEARMTAVRAASEVLGIDNVKEAEISMASEDFSLFLQAAPGSMLFLGIRNETVGSTRDLHNPGFIMDESVLPIGAALHAGVALQWLEEHHSMSAVQT